MLNVHAERCRTFIQPINGNPEISQISADKIWRSLSTSLSQTLSLSRTLCLVLFLLNVNLLNKRKKSFRIIWKRNWKLLWIMMVYSSFFIVVIFLWPKHTVNIYDKCLRYPRDARASRRCRKSTNIRMLNSKERSVLNRENYERNKNGITNDKIFSHLNTHTRKNT